MAEAPPKIRPKSLDDYLEVMSKAVFQSGMSWKVVEAKWPGIREAFHGFDVGRVADMSGCPGIPGPVRRRTWYNR